MGTGARHWQHREHGGASHAESELGKQAAARGAARDAACQAFGKCIYSGHGSALHMTTREELLDRSDPVLLGDKQTFEVFAAVDQAGRCDFALFINQHGIWQL